MEAVRLLLPFRPHPHQPNFFTTFVSFLTFLRIFCFSVRYKQLKSRQPYGNEAAASFRFCKPPERNPKFSIWCVSASMPEGGPGFIGAGPGIRDSLKAPGRAVVSVMAISRRPPPAGGYPGFIAGALPAGYPIRAGTAAIVCVSQVITRPGFSMLFGSMVRFNSFINASSSSLLD